MRSPFRILLLLGLAGVARAGDEDTKAADRELQRQVNVAIERGADWLASRQAADGGFDAGYSTAYPMGPTALATLALLHSGVPRSDPRIRRAFGHLRRTYDRIVGAGRRGNPYAPSAGLKVYSVSLTIMALAEYGRVRGRSSAESGYAARSLDSFHLERPDLEWMRELTSWLVSVQQGQGGWRYPEGTWDCSNSQYACLALKEARDCGIAVPRRTFEKALHFWLDRQEKSGKRIPRYGEEPGDGVYAATRYRTGGYDTVRGWGYVDPSRPTGSMTTAGVAGTAICLRELGGGHRSASRAKQAIRDGLAWLGERFSVIENPNLGPGWHFYYLYGLERAGVLGGVVHLGEHRWYAEGARFLVDAQQADGAFRAWASTGGGERRVRFAGPVSVVDQAFALLFLTRATEGTARRGTATEEPDLDLTKADRLDDAGLIDLFTAAFERVMKADDERFAKRAPAFAALGPRAIPPLIRLLDDADEARRERAVEILRAITGRSCAFDARMPEERRRRAVDDWTGWYLTNRSALRYDPATKLIGG